MSRFANHLLLSLLAAGLSPAAFAVLDRAGPVDPTHGFPAWYLDKKGVALELCVNQDAAVLSAGGCAVLPGPVPNGVQTVPEVFPSNWSTEHFYTLASASLTTAGVDKKTGAPVAGTGRLVVNMGLEGSFATGTPTAGAQITFNRWRITHTNTACTGSYTYYTPNSAPATYSSSAGGRVFQTSDVGIGSFDGPLQGSTGPFLQWSATPGGAVKAPFIGADGKKYIADYAALGTAVTGSELSNPLRGSSKAWIPAEIKAMTFANYVLVEGPGVVSGNCATTEAAYTTTGFQLFGRYFDGAIPSVSQIDRATYKAVDTNADGLPDKFQVGVWATVTQKAGGLAPVLGMSLFSGDPAAPTVQVSEAAMTRFALPTATGAQPRFEFFQGATTALQTAVPATALTRPASTTARVRIISDTPATVLNIPLVDELRISQALWDSAQKTLTVTAESGALLAAATPATQTALNADCALPCLTIDAYGLPDKDASGAAIDYKLKTIAGEKFAVMSAVIPNVHIPPATVTVNSSGGGRDVQPVMYAGSATGTALLQTDTASTAMNVAASIPVLANDVGVSATPALQICTAATGGTCAVPSSTTACVANTASPSCTAKGARLSISADNQVLYAPALNVGGYTESFWYQASTLSGLIRAQVMVNVGALTGLPDARDDVGLSAVATITSTFNVLANDFAPAGIDTASLYMTQVPCNLTNGVCAANAVSFNAGGGMLFTAPSAGSWTMAYTFKDRTGAVADPGVVTVNVTAGEVLTVARARWTAPKKAGQLGTLATNGTSSVAQAQSLGLYIPNVASGPQGCLNPTLGTRIATTTVAANASWTFAATALATRPTTVYVYSPAFGGCMQSTVQ
jgi:hypothetical protein